MSALFHPTIYEVVDAVLNGRAIPTAPCSAQAVPDRGLASRHCTETFFRPVGSNETLCPFCRQLPAQFLWRR